MQERSLCSQSKVVGRGGGGRLDSEAHLVTCYGKLWQDTYNKKKLFFWEIKYNHYQYIYINLCTCNVLLCSYTQQPVPGFQMVGSKITHKKQTQNEKRGKNDATLGQGGFSPFLPVPLCTSQLFTHALQSYYS